jgi:hypothetical protein
MNTPFDIVEKIIEYKIAKAEGEERYQKRQQLKQKK